MPIRVVESFLEGKRKDIQLCEDGFIVTEDFAVMIDGVSTKTDLTIDGKSTGRYLMELVKDMISDIEADISHGAFVEEIERQIMADYQKRGLVDRLTKEAHSRPAVNAVVFSKNKRELWFYGDAQAMIDEEIYTNMKYIDDVNLHVRKMVNEYHLANGSTVEELLEDDKGAAFIQPLLKMQQTFQSGDVDSSLSYASLDGFGFNKEEIIVVAVPEKVHHIVLATDGYPQLFSTLRESEDFLADVLRNDPLLIKEHLGFRGVPSGMNSFDDRAYIRFRL